MFRGYIKLWRKIEDNPLSHDPDFMAIWVWILLLANHKFKEWKIGYQKIPIKRGQFITSRNKLSIITGVNESKLERTMTYLQSEQQIEQQKFNNYRLITVINYNIYQPSEQLNEQQVNSKRTASEQQVNTTKECKNEKNEKNVILSPAGDGEFNSSIYIKEMLKNKRKDIYIIGEYFKIRDNSFPSLKAIQQEIRRWLKIANELAEYKPEQIEKSFLFVSEKFPKEWNLSTVAKYINQPVIWQN